MGIDQVDEFTLEDLDLSGFTKHGMTQWANEAEHADWWLTLALLYPKKCICLYLKELFQ